MSIQTRWCIDCAKPMVNRYESDHCEHCEYLHYLAYWMKGRMTLNSPEINEMVHEVTNA